MVEQPDHVEYTIQTEERVVRPYCNDKCRGRPALYDLHEGEVVTLFGRDWLLPAGKFAVGDTLRIKVAYVAEMSKIDGPSSDT